MGIHYKTNPKTFEELCDSTRGQVERTRELAMMGEELPIEECVVMTSEAMLALLDRVETLSEIAAQQTQMFVQMETMFRWIFGQLGVDIDELIAEYDEGEEG